MKALALTNDLPIKHQGEVHNGKVRSVYWLTPEDSARLIEERMYFVAPNSDLGIMVTSDRISAFDCNFKGETVDGVPQKGAALNAISYHWFNEFEKANLAGNHILEAPHPLVWIVQKADPIMVEGVARQYITGSMWRAYAHGEREFCGIALPEGLEEHQRLDDLLITPTTKGILDIPGVALEEDTELTSPIIRANYEKLGFVMPGDVDLYENRLRQGFGLISDHLAEIGQIFVDTKFEFGYVDKGECPTLVYIDEVGTPDSSRMWDAASYDRGYVIENSKEGFRQFLLGTLDAEVLKDKTRMAERQGLAAEYRVPDEEMMAVRDVYVAMAEAITGEALPFTLNPRDEIIAKMSEYDLIEEKS